ncbi:hypothetical protein BU23DRAFT_602335 [Bimuria novae-zelandiae CBS 107.79]|uniref:Uncharacterized protein n=1 Tax=Bimuria novae-zelandiae CBS 107.79 TaxID=1447943 RepID=A0A6A5UV48_9PLEO|nr:hypothetical protein BU23DRAFT_602335 [Bimuria novae-zelandiae CBS 107.79]
MSPVETYNTCKHHAHEERRHSHANMERTEVPGDAGAESPIVVQAVSSSLSTGGESPGRSDHGSGTDDHDTLPSSPPPSSPPVGLPAVVLPPQPQCDDRICCHPMSMPHCLPLPISNQFGNCTLNLRNPTRSGTNHPTRVCITCRRDGEAQRLNELDRVVDENLRSGMKAKLCKTCTWDEMQLYWQRVNSPRSTHPSLNGAQLNGWPTRPGNLWTSTAQNLCTCIQNVHNLHRGGVVCCHACRDEWFLRNVTRPQAVHDAMVYTKTSSIISGKRRITNLFDPNSNRVQQRHLNARIQKRTLPRYPCGKETVPPLEAANEFILYCMVCMGVLVQRHNIPDKYAEHRMPPLLRTTRVTRGAQNGYKNTLSPHNATRHHRFRVNIKRGWMSRNPLLAPDRFVTAPVSR